ncbi:MAG TPA: outer membrane beta-barrel protein [Bryobacteraceae bacterium]|nr:outer membrane beta-barrel protein [Bryobacteraceae bacterium]
MKTVLFVLLITPIVLAQNEPAQPSAPTPLSTPAITGPLTAGSPITVDAGPFGKIAVNGVVDGLGLWTGNYIPGDSGTQAALANGQIFLQKTEGWFQFYVQAGGYDIPSLGVPFLATDKTMSNFYGPVPVAFLKLAPGKNTNIEVGALPTMMGAEYTFTFENMNVERGLLWNQENSVTRGIQVNRMMGKVTASVGWNDGYYSNRYSWLSGSLTYANGPHSLAFVGMGSLGQTKFQTAATPAQNNGSMYAVLYTFNKGSWIIQPYYQYGSVPANQKIGVVKGNSTQSGAILVNHTFGHGFSLPVRWEYIASTGAATDPDVVNLMYGPGSRATSITVTPTFQYGRFFVRGDISYVHLSDITPGLAFGQSGTLKNQPRAIAEFGFLF